MIPSERSRWARPGSPSTLDDAARADLARTLADRVARRRRRAPRRRRLERARGARRGRVHADSTVIDDPGSPRRGRGGRRASGCAARGLRSRRRRSRRPPVGTVARRRWPRDGGAADRGRSSRATATTARRCCRCPVEAPFRFAYGPGSFRRHAAEARRLGLGVPRRARLRPRLRRRRAGRSRPPRVHLLASTARGDRAGVLDSVAPPSTSSSRPSTDPARRALAIGAHPDDIEFGCGGDARQVGGGGRRCRTCSSSPTARRAPGTRTPTSPSWSRPAPASKRRRRRTLGRHRRRVPRTSSTASSRAGSPSGRRVCEVDPA